MPDFIKPEQILLNDTLEPKVGRVLYGISAVLAHDSELIQGIRPGYIQLISGPVVRKLLVGTDKLVAIVRVSAGHYAVYDPASLRLAPKFSDRKPPYYASIAPEQEVVRCKVSNNQMVVGSLVVANTTHEKDTASLHFDPRLRHGHTDDGTHYITRITDSAAQAEGLIGAIANCMRLPDQVADWLMSQFFHTDAS